MAHDARAGMIEDTEAQISGLEEQVDRVAQRTRAIHEVLDELDGDGP